MSDSAIHPVSKLHPPELKGRASFEVFADDSSDPLECGMMTVVVDPNGFNLFWSGASADKWSLSWKELREMCQASEMEDAADRMKRAVREIEEGMAQKRFLKGEQEMGIVVPIESVRREP